MSLSGSLPVPANHNLTPTGWYMLFVVNADGVPSVATWLHLGDYGVSDPSDPPPDDPPQATTQLLRWTDPPGG